MELYKDEFIKSFHNNFEFFDFIREIEMKSQWFTKNCRKITFTAINRDSEIFNGLVEKYNENIVNDTIKNTNLLLKIGDDEFLVRDCAIKSILARAKINGNSLYKVKTNALAEILNYCMDVARGDTLFRFSNKKLSAIHSGNNSDYSILDMSELFTVTNDYLQFCYKDCTFAESAYSHSLVTALWNINDTSLTKTYEDLLDLHKVTHDEISTAVRLTTSDVGISGANLIPTLILGKRRLPIVLGNMIKLEHKAGANLDSFQNNLDLLHGTFQNALGKLEKLINVKIYNPINCMIGVMKRIGLPKKLSLDAIENFKIQYQDSEAVTAHDIYLGICEVIFLLQCQKASPIQIVNTEEIVARALSVNWSEYDTLIDLRW